MEGVIGSSFEEWLGLAWASCAGKGVEHFEHVDTTVRTACKGICVQIEGFCKVVIDVNRKPSS
jgi:hypothetical protein